MKSYLECLTQTKGFFPVYNDIIKTKTEQKSLLCETFSKRYLMVGRRVLYAYQMEGV